MGSKASWSFSAENEKAAKKKAKATKEAEDNRGGSGIGKDDRMKLTAKTNRILIVQPWSKLGDLTKKVMVHQVWKNRRPIATAACPRIKEGEDCEVCQTGWDLKDKYADNKSEKKQNLHKIFKPTIDNYCNAIDLEAKKKKVQVLKLPHVGYEAIMEQLSEDDMTFKEICHLDEGKALRIKGNGKDGNFRRYKTASFEKSPVNLLDAEEVTEEDILNGIHNLDLLQPKASEKKLADVLTKLKKQALGGSDDEDSDDEEDEDDTEDTDLDEDDSDDDKPAKKKKSSDKKKSKKSDDEDEDSDDDDEEDEEEEEEKPAKKKSSDKKKSKKPDDDDEEDEDEEDDEDSDDDDEDDDDDITDDDDEDDEEESDDEDEDSDDDDEDEEEKPAKKKASSKKTLKKKK